MSEELIHMLFELAAAALVFCNVRRLRRDKLVRGTDWRVQFFFCCWATWRLFYIPHTEWYTVLSAVLVPVAIGTYLAQMLYYIREETK